MPGSSELFSRNSRYGNSVFIESGTFYCGGIQQAIDAGYQRIISVELDDTLYSNAIARFKKDNRVEIVHGDSGVLLDDILSKLDEPATLWLDGHCSGPGTAIGIDCSPVVRELGCVKRHGVNTHTILIDDVRLMGTPAFDGVTLGVLCGMLFSINKRYKLSLETGTKELENDILLATV